MVFFAGFAMGFLPSEGRTNQGADGGAERKLRGDEPRRRLRSAPSRDAWRRANARVELRTPAKCVALSRAADCPEDGSIRVVRQLQRNVTRRLSAGGPRSGASR